MTDPTPHAAAEPVQPTVIVTERERRGSGGAWFIGIVLLIALIAGVFLFTRAQQGESAKDNAISTAASQVGSAAEQVGTAAQTAADSVAEDGGGDKKN